VGNWREEKNAEDGGRLAYWQQAYETSKNAYGEVLAQMDEREALYRGTRRIDRGANTGASGQTKAASHVRNIVFELIESQIESTIPVPKVSTMTQESVVQSGMIEDSLKADVERLPFGQINDMQERTTPIQGGSFFPVEWDNTRRSHNTVGDLSISVLHPKNVIPQAQAYELGEMDYVFVRLERTRAYIRRRYGVSVDEEDGANTDAPGREAQADDKVVQVLCYYKNEEGGVGLFTWANDTVLEDLRDYQARQLDVCAECAKERPVDADACACGGKRFVKADQDAETLVEDIVIEKNGLPHVIPKGTKVPYYKPNRFPLILRKNVSAYGQLLGDSDVDKVRDQQMLVNKLGTKIEEKLLKGGSYVSLPRGARVRRDDSEFKAIDVNSPQEVEMIKTINLQPNINFDSGVRERAYHEAKSTLGITDSYQGKADNTALSGVAKQIQVAQSSGRLESKRRMKATAYAALFETMFLFKLAYTDEPRPYIAQGANGEKQFGAFSRYAFLCVDDAGEYYYNDKFLFSTDPAGALGQNRQAMWEETRRNLHEGAFGDPKEPQTLLMFWGLMETLSYPMAGNIKASIQQKVEKALAAPAPQTMTTGAADETAKGEAGSLEVLLEGLLA
jgi:hypothetical protein